MAEIQRQRIKSIYSEIKGYLSSLPESNTGYSVPRPIVEHFNSLLGQLGEASETSYESHKLNSERESFNGHGYNVIQVKMSMSAVVQRLEDDFGLKDREATVNNPIVVTVNQNQEMSVAVVSIDVLAEEQDSDEIKEILRELKESVNSKNESKSRDLLKSLADKSWQVFIQVLPYILEHWGRR